MRLVLQPEGSAYCGQACVAMVADISLPEAIKTVGKGDSGTHTCDIVKALRALGVPCADRLRPVGRVKPVLPQRAIIAMTQYVTKEGKRRAHRAHWMVTWDGVIHDPGGRWPEGYDSGWKITSYLDLTGGAA